jgi:hypothetical protein
VNRGKKRRDRGALSPGPLLLEQLAMSLVRESS